jgi:hypothetical protein
MMTRQVARQFCRLGEVHSLVYGRRASGENGRKLTASTRQLWCVEEPPNELSGFTTHPIIQPHHAFYKWMRMR